VSKLPAIKPCPFCGAAASVEEIPSAVNGVRFSVGCDSTTEAACYGYQSFTEFNTAREAVEAWNRRAK
jgi:Lar family restriction alleviation protein